MRRHLHYRETLPYPTLPYPSSPLLPPPRPSPPLRSPPPVRHDIIEGLCMSNRRLIFMSDKLLFRKNNNRVK